MVQLWGGWALTNWENLGPFDYAMGELGALWWRNDKLEPLDDTIGGHYFHNMMRKLGALNGALENLGPFDDTIDEIGNP